MNVKLHTPSTLKAGSGLSSSRQFLLSLVATTISIVLTFGTAALVDHYKIKKEKKEMVMMLLSDFDNTISFFQRVDSGLVMCRSLQHEVALHPESYDSLKYKFPRAMSWIAEDYLVTTEKIFSSSIETFSTIGDVHFMNDVSSFYLARQRFKDIVLEEVRKESSEGKLIESQMSLLNFNFPEYVLTAESILGELNVIRDRCMQRMKVSEKDLSEFNERNQKVEDTQINDPELLNKLNEFDSYNSVLQEAKEKLKN